jgi:hypothetical protein
MISVKNCSMSFRCPRVTRINTNNKKFLQGNARKAQSAGRKADKRFTLCAKRHAPCAMRSPPWPPEAI